MSTVPSFLDFTGLQQRVAVSPPADHRHRHCAIGRTHIVSRVDTRSTLDCRIRLRKVLVMVS